LQGQQETQINIEGHYTLKNYYIGDFFSLKIFPGKWVTNLKNAKVIHRSVGLVKCFEYLLIGNKTHLLYNKNIIILVNISYLLI